MLAPSGRQKLHSRGDPAANGFNQMTFPKQGTYLLDGEEVSWRELIRAAEDIDTDFRDDWMKSTSMAAAILRDHGYAVEEAN